MEISATIDFAPLARDLGLPEEQLRRTVELLDEGNTVPFITRYRRDRTGGLDEEQIRRVQELATRQRLLAERKRTILKSIESQGKLNDELAQTIAQADSTKRLEDLYLPFKPKKQTLATIAREKGLEPLAREILGALPLAEDLDLRSLDFVDQDKGLRSQADVLLGVGHLIAEHFSERAELREALRGIVRSSGKIVCSKIPASEERESAAADEDAGDSGEADERAVAADAEGAASTEAAAPAEAAAPLEDSRVPTQSSVSSTQSSPPDETTSAAETPSAEGAKPAEETAPAEDSAVNPSQAPSGPPPSSESAAPAEEAAPATQPAGESQAQPASEPDPAAKAAEQKRLKEQARAERRRRKEEEKKRKRKKKEAAYKDYFNFQQPLAKLPPHRILAINRGERARVLRVKLEADQDAMRAEAERLAIPAEHPHREFLRGCLKDALSRLVFPALEREVRRELTDKAEEHAVTVFARNLRKLLLMPPVSRHRVLAIDPGFKSGCKLAALDEFGNLHGHGAIYLVGPEERQKRSRARLVEMISMHKITVVAIGNGTACRETERLVADVLANELKDQDVQYVIVNEAGASVYSTSPVGREELGQYEASQRSAVSIGRRLLDPLSELVKINPANIGVGLYQHDMKAKHLQDSLDAVVESCVNYVGVDLNTASPSLLRYVSGLNQLTARRVYEYRQQHGPFTSREQLKDVPGIGEATFVQAAGFLRIAGGDNPLDATWIHPESYGDARRILEKLDCSVDELARQVNATQTLNAARRRQAAEFAAGIEGGAGTAGVEDDTIRAQAQEGEGEADSAEPGTPGDVPHVDVEHDSSRAEAQEGEGEADAAEPGTPGGVPHGVPHLDVEHDSSSAEAQEGEGEAGAAEPGTPGDVPHEGAPPAQASKLVEKVNRADPLPLARELEIGELLCRDILGALKRPGRDPREDLPPPLFRREILKLEDLRPGMQLAGTVLNVVDFGAFVDIGLHDTGLVHISRLADRFIKDPHEVVSVGDTLDVWVLGIDKERRRVQLTAIQPGTEKAPPQRRSDKKRTPRPGVQGKETSQDKPQRRDRDASGQRRPRRHAERREGGRDRRDQRADRSKAFVLQSKKEKKPKLTKAMKEGRAPLRTFGDLKQFLELQQDEPPAAAAEQPAEHKNEEKKSEKKKRKKNELSAESTPAAPDAAAGEETGEGVQEAAQAAETQTPANDATEANQDNEESPQPAAERQ